jgi:predicted metal-dependent phosphotriesterase family hydrolase
LQNLWMLKENPNLLSTNKRLDSIDTMCREINFLEPAIILDVTTAEKRDVLGLSLISQRLQSSVITYCTGPQCNPDFDSKSVTSLIKDIVTEMICGVPTASSGRTLSAPAAIAITIESQSSPIGSNDLKAISCVSHLHEALESYVSTPPPIFIELSYGSEIHRDVLLLLAQSKTNLSKVVICRNMISRSSAPYYASLLDDFSSFLLCFDCWGGVVQPLDSPLPPNDTDAILGIIDLISLGHRERLIVSPSVRYKIDLCEYGGPGYGHIQRSVQRRMFSAGMSEETIQCLCSSNCLRILQWYIPPPPIIAKKDLLRCFLCGKEFPAGEQYSKFNFVYCSSACLDTHRKTQFR